MRVLGLVCVSVVMATISVGNVAHAGLSRDGASYLARKDKSGKTFREVIEEVGTETGLPPSLLAAICAVESAWGTSKITACGETINGAPPAPARCPSGEPRSEGGKGPCMRQFPSFKDAVRSIAKTLCNSGGRYAEGRKVMNAAGGDIEKFDFKTYFKTIELSFCCPGWGQLALNRLLTDGYRELDVLNEEVKCKP